MAQRLPILLGGIIVVKRVLRYRMTTSQLILTDCVSLILLGITTLLTRATPRRILGALAGGLAAALLNVGEDIVAFSLGWWYYPSVATSYGPPLMYVAVGLWYGAGVALIGWRLTRRFGWRGAGD